MLGACYAHRLTQTGSRIPVHAYRFTASRRPTVLGRVDIVPARSWTYLSNHGHVLVCLARWPDIRLREAAERVGVTERAVQQIVADLQADGVVTKTRVGRRNRYSVRRDSVFRHPLEAGVAVGSFLDLVTGSPGLGDASPSA